jgi:hypothetical protein
VVVEFLFGMQPFRSGLVSFATLQTRYTRHTPQLDNLLPVRLLVFYARLLRQDKFWDRDPKKVFVLRAHSCCGCASFGTPMRKRFCTT